MRGPAETPAAAGPSREERRRVNVARYFELKREAGANFRERLAIVREIKDDDLWQGEGDASFDAWAARVLGLGHGAVTKMLGIAYGPIGGERRRGPGGRPDARRSATPGGDADASRGRAREGQEGQVEQQWTASQPRSSSMYPDGVATGRDFVGWAARQLERLERHGMAGRLAGLSAAERLQARRVFAGLRDFFRTCEEASQ